LARRAAGVGKVATREGRSARSALGLRSLRTDRAHAAYDEDFATRVRLQRADEGDVTEKAMFGRRAFLLHDHMAVGLTGSSELAGNAHGLRRRRASDLPWPLRPPVIGRVQDTTRRRSGEVDSSD
jgi:hypothetical protein